ncbi:MAG: HNH endonuclease [Planctomycetes bacterium]|nr:HNH endonuclease [Planctomycetota bacterium]
MFCWLQEQVAVGGDVLPRALLTEGFRFGDRKMPALHPAGRGIWKPKGLTTALSLTTAVGSPYSDRIEDDRLLYSYQGQDPESSDNRAVRRALEESTPLAYFWAVKRSWYLAAWPMFVVGDDLQALRFTVQADPMGATLGGASFTGSMGGAQIAGEAQRRTYGTQQVQIRHGQQRFRERVLTAYQTRCAMCRLSHRELLDAAHIIPDADGGKPEVPNGLALCKIHHAAFDSRVLGINPEGHRIRVREDVLEGVDGPMLRHGIQGMDGKRLWVPRSPELKPSPGGLRRQWDLFTKTA